MCKKFLFVWVSFVFLFVQTFADEETTEETSPWKEQLSEMGYWLLYNSTINVINGINLTKEQATALRDLAKDVEKNDNIPHPKMMSEDVKKVCDVYADLANVLLKQEEISDELRNKVIQTRALESKIIRQGLTYPRSGYKKGDCMRCHLNPGEKPQGNWEEIYKQPKLKEEMASAHSVGAIGNKLTVSIWLKAKKVDSILTENQKKVFEHFTCCLIPPKEMSDPVRVGQASVPNFFLDLLKKARETPENQWAVTKKFILYWLEKIEEIKYPGVTKEQKNAMKERFEKVLEKARSLSDVDFEMQKEDLYKELEGDREEQNLSAKIESFKRAFFLLFPGSVNAYNNLIRRIDEEATKKPATDLEKIKESPHSS